MDAKTMNRTSGPKFGTKMALLASAAVMSMAFTANIASAAPRADVSYTKAQKALTKGKATKAVEYAEAAVLAEPQNAQYRALLAKAYLEAGRYQSAARSYGDAIALGDQDPRTVLGYALTQTAIGGGKNALDALAKFERSMDPADAGLAIALAGNPERGVFVLTNALRAGQNTAKVRQNLAYTYALSGNWRGARVMAAEDVPANQLDERLSQWAANAKPEDHMIRVATLLGISPAADSGMPTALALTALPNAKGTLAAAKPEKAPARAAKVEAKPVKTVVSAPKAVAKAPSSKSAVANPAPAPVKAVAKAGSAPSKTLAKAPAPRKVNTRTPVVAPAKPVAKAMEAVAVKPAPKRVSAVAKPVASTPKPVLVPRRSTKSGQAANASFTFVSRPVTQTLPVSATVPQRVAAVAQKTAKSVSKPKVKAPKGDSHLIQLGSYNSEAEAKAGWTSLTRKFRDLTSHDVVITKAEVKGKTYFRVAAAGFGRLGAAQMCSTVRSAGRGCFAYVKTSPPAGAVGKGVRIAAATR